MGSEQWRDYNRRLRASLLSKHSCRVIGINGLLQQLSWWDVADAKPVDLAGPRYKEFFVLEAQLNLLKGQVRTL